MLIFCPESPRSDRRFDKDASAFFVIADPEDSINQVSEFFSAHLFSKRDIVPVDEIFGKHSLKLAPAVRVFPLLLRRRIRVLLSPFPRGFLDSPFRELLKPPFDQYLS